MLAEMTAEVLDLPTVAMYAFCLLSGWCATRWMVQKHTNRFQKQAAAIKLEDLDSQALADVGSPIALNKKTARANAESRKRAKKASNKIVAIKSLTEDESSKANAAVAHKPEVVVEVNGSTNLDKAEITPDATDCTLPMGAVEVSLPCCNSRVAITAEKTCDTENIMSPNTDVEVDSSQIEGDHCAVELQLSPKLVSSKIDEGDLTSTPLPQEAATVLSKPRTQADKDLLKLEKKLREVESLKLRLAEGQELQPNQLEKLAQENSFCEQVLALTEGDLQDQPGSDVLCLPKISMQVPGEDLDESSSPEDPKICSSSQETSDEQDESSTRSSDDAQSPGYRLDWNDPAWESAEPPCLRFRNLSEPDEEEDDEEEYVAEEYVAEEETAEVPNVTPLDGSFFMPVGFMTENQEYIPFMETPSQPTDVFWEPAVLQKVVMEPTIFEPVVYDQYMQNEPQIEQAVPGWSPVSSHDDWEGLGAKRGVRSPCNDWNSPSSRDNWETNKRSTWHNQYETSRASPCDTWENQGSRWDEPWGM